jgi:hypothetical protein
MQMVIKSKPSLIKTFLLLAVASILHIIITEDYYKYFIKNTFCSSTNWQALPQSCSVPLFIWVILWIVFHITFVDFMQQPCSSFTVYTSITLLKLHILWKSIILQHFMTLYYMALMLLPPHKFVYLPCFYYQLQEIGKYEVGVASSGITFILVTNMYH